MKTTILIVAGVLVSYLAYGPLQIAKPEPQPAQQPATAALQQQLDDLQRTTATLVAAQEKDEARRPADPACKTATELGAKPGDDVDDYPALQAALDKGYAIELDGSGIYTLSAPLRPTPGQSTVIKGQSAGYRHGAKGCTGLTAANPNVTHLIELPGDTTKHNGQVAVIRDVYLLGNDKCDGIRIHGCRVATIENCVIRNCAKGVAVTPTISCYAANVRGCSILNCGIGIELNNAATVCCFAAYSTEIIGGAKAIVLNGWKRGAVFMAVPCENQTAGAMHFTDARATLIGDYNECPPNAGITAKDSKITIIDTSAGGYKGSLNSQFNWVGDNMQAGTLDY